MADAKMNAITQGRNLFVDIPDLFRDFDAGENDLVAMIVNFGRKKTRIGDNG